jgi:hypothetical protein
MNANLLSRAREQAVTNIFFSTPHGRGSVSLNPASARILRICSTVFRLRLKHMSIMLSFDAAS